MAVAVLTALLLTAGSPALAAPKAGTAAQATVSGTVWATDGLAIPGATIDVSVLGKTGTYEPVVTLSASDAGAWSYSGKGGQYRFTFSAQGTTAATRDLTMVNKSVYSLDVTLEAYGTIAGTIIDAGSGIPVGGSTVDFFMRNTDGTWPTAPSASVTAADGSYASGSLPAGTYAVRASATGYGARFHVAAATIDLATPIVVMRGSAATAIDVTLPAVVQTARIQGHVYIGAGMSPMSAYISYYRQNDDGTWPASGWGYDVSTATDGSYTSRELPLGNYKVRFFGVHTGTQWWMYTPTMDLATVVVLDAPGQVVTDIDGWFGKP
jgi:hypothetical protein